MLFKRSISVRIIRLIFVFTMTTTGTMAQNYEGSFKTAVEKNPVLFKLAMAIAQHESRMNPFA